MGNHRRGAVTVRGTRLVVGPCRFQRLTLAGTLRPDPMKGDTLAMRLRCPS
jgi:hypothetical protein